MELLERQLPSTCQLDRWSVVSAVSRGTSADAVLTNLGVCGPEQSVISRTHRATYGSPVAASQPIKSRGEPLPILSYRCVLPVVSRESTRDLLACKPCGTRPLRLLRFPSLFCDGIFWRRPWHGRVKSIALYYDKCAQKRRLVIAAIARATTLTAKVHGRTTDVLTWVGTSSRSDRWTRPKTRIPV